MLNIFNSDDINDYIKTHKHVSIKMICKQFNLKPKHAHNILKFNDKTMLDNPRNYGSNKFKNYNLYKYVNETEIKNIIKNEKESLKKVYNNTQNYNAFIESGLDRYLFQKYR